MAKRKDNNGDRQSMSPDCGSADTDLTPWDLIVAGMKELNDGLTKLVEQRMHNQLVPLYTKVEEFSRGLATDRLVLDRVVGNIADLMKSYGTLEAALKERSVLSEQYFGEHVIEPMSQTLFPAIDLIDDALAALPEEQSGCDTSVRQLLGAIKAQHLQFLIHYSIEYIRHEPGTAFDPQVMKPAKVVLAPSVELDHCMASSLQAGFRVRQGRLLRPESVAIYACQNTENRTL